MQNQRLVNAMKKQGLEVKIVPNSNDLHYVEKDGRIVEWYVQNDNAVCVTCRRSNDHSDAMIDYSAGFFVRTIKNATQYIAGQY